MNAVTVPQASIKYFITDQHGRFIMTCTLGTLALVFSLTRKQCERIEKETAQLDGECKTDIGYAHMEFKVEWSPITVRRLPIEIPASSSGPALIPPTRCRTSTHPGWSPRGFQCILTDGHAGEHVYGEAYEQQKIARQS